MVKRLLAYKYAFDYPLMLLLLFLVSVFGKSDSALPPFSWDTLPVFYHSSNQSGDFSRDALETIAKFSMVTIEKWQAYKVKGVDDEDAMVIAMRCKEN